MSGLLTFFSEAADLVVIDLALNIFCFKQGHRHNKLSFDENIMLNALWLERLRDELLSLQKEHPGILIGINMEFIHSCQDNGDFLHFADGIEDISKVFFYNILPDCDLQARMRSDMEESGIQPEFDKDAGVLFMLKSDRTDGKSLAKRCEQVIQFCLEEIVGEIVSDTDQLELLASSSIYVDRHVDIKRLFTSPDKLRFIVYYMSQHLLAIDKEYDALVATSKNGAVLAALLGRMTGLDVVFCVNIGPQYALSASAVEQIRPGKRYVYVYDFICLGTEAKLLHALVTSRRATLIGGIGVASYLPLDNPELREKHSPLMNMDCLVNLISAGIPYHIFLQKDTAGPQVAAEYSTDSE